MEASMQGLDFVQKLSENLKEGSKAKFQAHRKVLSFWEYLAEVTQKPQLHLRSSSQYFTDVFNHFGSYEVRLPQGNFKRYRVFDAEWDHHDGQVMGHERVQETLVRLLQNFVRSGKVDRLILLHGPNGSAKTSLIQALVRAAEVYSQTDEGALYRFNWVFPLKKTQQGGLGFSSPNRVERTSYAHLDNDEIEARLPCEHKDHPFLLLDSQHRDELVHQMLENEWLPRDFPIPEVLRRGNLSPKNKKIFDALYTAYLGDVEEVFRHIQVERFYLSRRYRSAFSAVEPQMSVDAYAKQVTMDQSLGSLPSSLRHLSLFETGGPLTDANRGLIEYSDLLKRPIESWKYLLIACEQAQASVDVVSIFLDLVMIASSNELHLTSFREYPDWQSFKGRFELVRVPYMLRFSDELKIYENQIPKALTGLHIAPHSLAVAAMWSVLTRLEAPRVERYDERVKELVRSLTPLEKLELYDAGIVPERLSQKETKELKAVLPALCVEFDTDADYEGRYGASPREMRMLLLNAAQDQRFDHLSPIAVLDQIRLLIQEKTSYEFLRREPVRGYRDAAAFIEVVSGYYSRKLDEEVRTAMGLIRVDSHKQLFERYIKHVSSWTKKEKLLNPLTGKLENPDVDMMTQVEKILLATGETPEDFRKSVISQIGAYRLENPDRAMDYAEMFTYHFRRLKDDYFHQQKNTVDHVLQCFLKLVDGDDVEVSEKDKDSASTLLKNMLTIGYNKSSARHAVAFLLKTKIL